ncbi:hypothetical protein RRG08_053440 [Elysia crispata]|uniref:Uncharacterized protein n=1 Tax=Elysia crispata TaxID=231223 RepID=A0AAE1DGB9_9GAST|nr:hypothetical protein RRG08_053440 [Elysia crispata]
MEVLATQHMRALGSTSRPSPAVELEERNFPAEPMVLKKDLTPPNRVKHCVGNAEHFLLFIPGKFCDYRGEQNEETGSGMMMRRGVSSSAASSSSLSHVLWSLDLSPSRRLGSRPPPGVPCAGVLPAS